MKKILFILLAVFTFSFVQAQDFHFGAKAGVNLANLSSSNSEFNNMIKGRTAYHVGVVAEISFSDAFSVQPELLYSSLGASFDTSASMRRASDSSPDYVINYLSVPVMAKYYVADGFSLELGPQIGFLTGAKVTDGTNEEDIKDYFESTDFGLGFGAGYKMENGLFFNARYGLGLSNISKDASDGDWVKNNAFQFSVGFMFN